MFKGLENSFEKRKSYLLKQKDQGLSIKEGLYFYLQKEFGDHIKGLSIGMEYEARTNSLIISAANKILANELTIRLPGIIEFLKDRNIRLSRILIR